MILVLGTTGRLGREVLRQLTVKGLPVRTLAADAPHASHFEGQPVEVVIADLRRPETLEPAFNGVKTLFLVTPGSPDQIASQQHAIQAAIAAGVERIVKVSELGASPSAPLDHLRMSWQIEQQLVRSGIPYTIIRPQFFMQNFLFVIAPSVTAEDMLYAPISEGRIPFVDLRDVAEVAVAALTEPDHVGKVYEVTGPEALTFPEVARHLSSATCRNIRFEEVSPAETWDLLVRSGLPTWYADDLLALYESVRKGQISTASSIVSEVTHHGARTLRSFLGENRDAFATAFV